MITLEQIKVTKGYIASLMTDTLDKFGLDLDTYYELVTELSENNEAMHFAVRTKERYLKINTDKEIKPFNEIQTQEEFDRFALSEPAYTQINELALGMLSGLTIVPLGGDVNKIKDMLSDLIPEPYQSLSLINNFMGKELCERVAEIGETLRELADSRFYIIDTETVGKDKDKRPVQVSIIETDTNLNVIRSKNIYILQKDIDDEAQRIHGLSEERLMELNAIEPIEAVKEISNILDNNQVLVGHNVAFDYTSLKQLFEQAGKNFEMGKFCTYLRRGILPHMSNYKLETICLESGITPDRLKEEQENIFGVQSQAHDAMYDTVCVLELLRKYPKYYRLE